MLTSLLSLPFRFLGAAPCRSRAPRRTLLAVEWLEQRDVPSVTITPTTLPNPKVGAKYPSQTLAGHGGAKTPYTFTKSSGTLPPGLTLSSAGTLSGTPTGGGSFTFTLQAADSSSPAQTGTQSYTVTVSAPTITFSPRTLAAAPAGVTFTRTITATGGTAPYTFTFTKSTLPKGVSVEVDPKDKTGTKAIVTGITSAAGTFTFTISVKDKSTGTGPFTFSRSFSLAINPARLVFLSQPAGAAMSATLPAFAVEVLNQSGKPVTGTVSLRLIPVVTEARPAFTSTSTTRVKTAADGVATFSNVAITTRGRFRLKASIGSLSVLSDVFDIGLSGRHSP